jgi:acylphosphatase
MHAPLSTAVFGAMATHRQRLGERREVHYSGHVQGVGFRFTVRELADGFEVAGYVRNLADGRVQLVVEGMPAELDRFLAAIDERMSDYIRSAAVDVRPNIGEFAGFEVRH